MKSPDDPHAEFAREVLAGLCGPGPKNLPAKFLYDAIGTALFEAITLLPEYGLTRADERLLRLCTPSLAERFQAAKILVAELGSGNGSKTRLVLDAFGEDRILSYSPIDVSAEAVRRCEQEFGNSVTVQGHVGAYLDGVEQLRKSRPDDTPLLLLFVGSSIGNFEPAVRGRFLGRLRSQLRKGDCVLIGFDLVKPRDTLLRAYDDRTGVTAAFNRNMLGRVNRELGAGFDLASFKHLARYDEGRQRVEMHLRSEIAQSVAIPGCAGTCVLARGETIWTESSYKFRPVDARQMMAAVGFRELDAWTDSAWPFLEGLWTVDA